MIVFSSSFHGCDICYSPTSYNPITCTTFASLKLRQEHKVNYMLQKMPGYRVITMWEHEWTSLKLVDPDLRDWLRRQEIVDPIQVRDCLYGGRTNALVLYYNCLNRERINYADVTSLYPYVQKYKRYPCGHPTIITENFDDDDFDSYFGIAKCTILPPQNLYVPVLPAKINGKLVFTLCYTCAMEQNQERCTHTDEERALTFTWCTVEIKKAIEKGYKIIKLHEVYHYNESDQYDPVTKTGGIFTRYIDSALKTKQEASGFPQGVETEEQKDDYIRKYYEHEGVLLEKSKIKKNPGLRTISKLALNSLWGKYFCLLVQTRLVLTLSLSH